METKKSALPAAAFFLLAFACTLYPLTEWQFPLFGAAVVLTFVWSFFLLTRDFANGWALPKSPVLIFTGLFWALAFASVFWSEIKPASIVGLCLFSLFPLAFFTGVLRGSDPFFWIVAIALGVLFAVLSLWAIIQFFFLNAYFMGQARHPLSDPSSLGALFSLGLFCALGWLLAAPAGPTRIMAAGLCTLLLCGIISTVSRGSALALLPAFLLLCAMLWPQVKARAVILAVIFALTAGYYALTLTGAEKRFDLGGRIEKGLEAPKPDAGGQRMYLWESTMAMIGDRPLLGTGIGTYSQYYPEYRSYEVRDANYMAHSDPLQFWAELGLFGPLLFYAAGIAIALRMMRAIKAAPQPKDRILLCSLFCGFAAMTLHAHVNFNFYTPCLLLLSGLMLSLWFRVSGRVLGETAQTCTMNTVPAGVGKALVALPFVMIGWILLSIVAGEYYAGRARDNLFAGEMMCLTPAQERSKDCFQENINRASRVSMDMNVRAYLFAVNVPMTILQHKAGKFANDAEVKALYEQVAGYMHRVLALNPRSGTAHYYLGRVQELVPPGVVPAGAPDGEAEYKTALRLDPMHLGARLALAALYKKEGRPLSEQLSVLEPAARFYFTTPEAGEYYAALSKLYLEMRNYGKVQETMQLAQEFKARSDFSKARQEASLPQAVTGGSGALPPLP